MAIKWFKLADRKPKNDQDCWITGERPAASVWVMIGPVPWDEGEQGFIDPDEDQDGVHQVYDATNGVTHWCAAADIKGPEAAVAPLKPEAGQEMA